MYLPIDPVSRDADHLRWAWDEVWIEGTRTGANWVVALSWSPDPFAMVTEPTVGTRMGTSDAVAHLQLPLALGASQRLECWLEWPLELLIGGEKAPVETARPLTRRAVLGTVDGGLILPAATCALLDDPSAVRSPLYGAIRIAIHNKGQVAVSLRRCPIAEDALSVFRKGQAVVAGTMHIRVLEALRAEAVTRPLAAPAGFVAVTSAPSTTTRGRLDWLLDATRGSTEFQL